MQKSVQNCLHSIVQPLVQNPVQPQRGFIFIEGAMQAFPVAPAERSVHIVYRTLRWSCSYQWLTVSYKQDAPLELQHRAKFRAVARAVSRADNYAELHADCRAVIVQMSVQKMAAMQKMNC